MAEAMGFELMDLLQSTVFKTTMYAYTACGLQDVFGANTSRVRIGYRARPARGDFLVLVLNFSAFLFKAAPRH